MELKKKTFEDLVGNFADDAKKAFDEIFERQPATKSETTVGMPGVAAPVNNLAGTAGGAAQAGAAIGGLTATVSGLNETVGGLASLPEQIARLSELIEKLLPAIETLSGALGTAGNVAGAVQKATPTRTR